MTIYPSRFESGSQGGFSLVGMVLLLFVFTLAGSAIFTLMKPAFTSSGLKITNARVDALRSAISDYMESHGGSAGTAPASLSALVTTDGTACTANNTPSATAIYHTLQGWCGPYIDQVFVNGANQYQSDGWGQLFIYNATLLTVTSCGPDQICGDGDDITFSL